jgi:hypothetical protein
MNPQTPQSPPRTSPNSCVNCNKWHRKCDRITPICGNCASKNKECIYKKSKRRKVDPSESDIRYKPYPNAQQQTPIHAPTPVMPPPQPHITMHQASHIPSSLPLSASTQEQFTYLEQILSVVPKQVDMTPLMPALEQYFEQVYMVSPLVDRTKDKLIRAYLRSVRTGTQDTLTQQPDPEDKALLYAMRAFFFKRIELSDLAQDYLNRSVDQIRYLYDDVMSNYTVAAAFYYIALCFMGIGQMDKASFYVHSLDGFLKRCESSQQPPTGANAFDISVKALRERYLRTMHHIAVYNMSPVTDMARLVKIFLLSHLQNKQYLKLVNEFDLGKTVSSMAGLTNDEALDRFLPLADMIRFDLDNNKNTFHITWDSIDLMTSKMKDIVNEPLLERGEIELYSKRVGFYLICQGARIQCLQRAGHDMDALARRVAEHIAYISSGTAFHFCHHNVSGPLALALLTLLKHFDIALDDTDRIRLLDHAETTLNSMKLLSNKYPIVTIKYGDLITDSANIILERKEQAGVKNYSIGDVNVVAPVAKSPEDSEFLDGDLGSLLSDFFTEIDFNADVSLSKDGRALETPANEMFFL